MHHLGDECKEEATTTEVSYLNVNEEDNHALAKGKEARDASVVEKEGWHTPRP